MRDDATTAQAAENANTDVASNAVATIGDAASDNLDQFDAELLAPSKDYTEIQIYNTKLPDCPPTGVYVEVWSRDSEQFKASRYKINTAAARSPGRRLAGANLSRDEQESVERALAAACVKSWRQKGVEGGIKAGGQVLACTPQNVVLVMRKYATIQEQVIDASFNRGNF